MTLKDAKRLVRSLGGTLLLDRDYDEYQVKFRGQGTYHTTDLSDALGTARMMSPKVSRFDSSKQKKNPSSRRGKRNTTKGDIKIRLVNPGDEAKLKTLLRHVGYGVVSETMENPATSGPQYRLAQAVISGTAKIPGMPVSVAREIVAQTPARLRSKYSKRNSRNPGVDIYTASLAPGIAERITRGAQGLVGRKRRTTKRAGARAKRRNPHVQRIYISRIKLDRGGYDSGGSYWGVGQPLFQYESEDGSVEGQIRADDAKHARLKVIRAHPNILGAKSTR